MRFRLVSMPLVTRGNTHAGDHHDEGRAHPRADGRRKLEHQFMVQYLYAAFSLKKNPDSTCDAAAFESVRRWASTAYAIARQEMEHLSVVNSILTAIGGPPCFYHDGFPPRIRWYTSSSHAR